MKDAIQENAQILVVGAGGLGCEILKNLALSGIRNIFVIDLDTIELSNLNRQFLFRQKDIGKFKAEVATDFIKEKFTGINIKWSNKKVQDLADDFFKQFNIIIGGLDNMEARRWINQKVHDLTEFDEKGEIILETLLPFIDGGTEGFRGQSRIIIPYKTSCLECTSQLTTNRNVYALCTIAETPRLPEHCIEYIYLLKWKENFDRPVDKDSYDDVNWINIEAQKRADSYGIEGVNYSLTLGVIKNVIPAIASTNALIAASTCLEAIKILSGCSKTLNNYFMYMGHEGIYSDNSEYLKKENCDVCSTRVRNVKVSAELTLKQFIDYNLKIKYNLKDPSIFSGSSMVYVTNPISLKEAHAYKLDYSLKRLVDEKEISISSHILVVDETLKKQSLKIKLNFQ